MAEAAVGLDEKRNEAGSESIGKAPAWKRGPRAYGSAKKALDEEAAGRVAAPNPELPMERIDDGMEFLRQLALEKLKTGAGKKLIDALFLKTGRCDSHAVWALIKILEGKKRPAKEQEPRKGQGRSWAAIWSAEPQWEEAQEETAEVGAGGREPEM